MKTKTSYITSKPWGGASGIGHQFYNWIVGWILANKYNLNYVYSPFCGDSIIPGNIDIPVKCWNSFLNFGDGEIKKHNLPTNIQKISLPQILSYGPSAEMFTAPRKEQAKYQVGYDIHSNRLEWQKTIKQYQNQQVLFECCKNQFITIDWDHLKINKLRDKYWKTRSKAIDTTPIYFDRNKTNVAIHIRRGDVTQDGKYRARWVSSDIYKTIMDQIRQTIRDGEIEFFIFTDATSLNEFNHLEEKDTTFKLWGTNTLNVFRHMTMADILVTGQSTFSCLAALLCRGIKLTRPWGPLWDNFPENDNFIIVNNEGYFDTTKLKGLL